MFIEIMQVVAQILTVIMAVCGVLVMGGLGVFFGLLIKDSMSKDPAVREMASRYMDIG